MNDRLQFKRSTIALFIGLFSIALFLESSIPYLYAERKNLDKNTFLGQIIYTPDQDMYFSFIRQAHDGHFIFSNRLTYIPNKPAFINLQFWLVGTLQRFTGLSENGIYYLWRFMGVLLLTIGIFMLARILLPTRRQVLACMALLLFTGGFGFLFAALNSAHLIGLEAAHAGILDMKFGFLPFQQAMTNPNFSFPHGFILIAYGWFLLGEQTGKTKYYILCGLFFNIIGLIRPYDIMAPYLIFPAYILLTDGFRFRLKELLVRLLPLFMIVPVLGYNVWLFKINDIFKYWSLQGLNAGSLPSPILHYLAYGIAGILAIIRVAQIKKNPFTRTDRFLLVWFLVTFVVIQLGKYLPIIGFSPQIGVYLAIPLGLLGCSIRFRPGFSTFKYYGVIAIVTACVVISNVSILMYYCKNFNDTDKTPIFYANKNEMDAMQWLAKNTAEGTVVLAMPSTSLRIAKYTSDNVVAAHYSVTPHYKESAAMASHIYADSVLGAGQKETLQKLNIGYIYIGPSEIEANNVNVLNDGTLTQVYANALVRIYKVN